MFIHADIDFDKNWSKMKLKDINLHAKKVLVDCLDAREKLSHLLMDHPYLTFHQLLNAISSEYGVNGGEMSKDYTSLFEKIDAIFEDHLMR